MCPAEHELMDYAQGMAEDAEAQRLEAHLATCAECRSVVSALAPESTPQVDLHDASTVQLPRSSEQRYRLPPGSLLAGRYVITRFLAAGGMGKVYEAEDLELHERVALKTVFHGSEKHLARFRRELSLARKVTHRNVCRVFDLNVHRQQGDDEIGFLTMELIAGETLSARLRRGALGVDDALQIASEIAAGLGAAHSAGVIHGDLKSSNVMLRPADASGPARVVVTDFGLAKSKDASPTDSLIGAWVGTPGYMAPEQLEGRPPTVASDLYSFGVVLFEMVTGRMPFRGPNREIAAIARLNEEPPPPSTFTLDLPRVWDATILRCLARSPAERFAVIEDVMLALRGESAAPLRQRRRGGAVLVGAAGLTIAAGVGLALLARTAGDRAPLSTPPAATAPSGAAARSWTVGDEAKRLLSMDAIRLRAVAQRSRRDGDFAAARVALESLRAIAPGDPHVQLELAWVYWRVGYVLRARELARSTERAALSARERAELEALLAELDSRSDLAATLLEALIRGAPEDLELRLWHVAALGRSAQYDAALDAIAKVRATQRIGSDLGFDLAEVQMHAQRQFQGVEALMVALIERAGTKGRVAGRARQSYAWWLRRVGRPSEAMFVDAARIAAGASDYEVVAACYWSLGTLADGRGDREAARTAFETARAVAAEAGSPVQLGSALNGLASQEVNLDPQRGLELFLEAARWFREIGDVLGQSQVLGNAAIAAGQLGRWDESERHFHAALDLLRDLPSAGNALVDLRAQRAFVWMDKGDLLAARSELRQLWTQASTDQQRWTVGWRLALNERATGDVLRAEKLCAAIDAQRELMDGQRNLLRLVQLEVALEREDAAKARQLLRTLPARMSVLLAALRLRRSERPTQALALLDAVPAVDRHYGTEVESAEAYLQLGRLAQAEGKLAAARARILPNHVADILWVDELEHRIKARRGGCAAVMSAMQRTAARARELGFEQLAFKAELAFASCLAERGPSADLNAIARRLDQEATARGATYSASQARSLIAAPRATRASRGGGRRR